MSIVQLGNPGFYDDVEIWLDWVILVLALGLMAWAFIHVLLQRADAFSAVGTFSKPAWLAILGSLLFIVGLFVAIVNEGRAGLLRIFIWLGLGAAAYYLLETRRGIKDISEGPW
ncbi:MAG TPA: DUF2516 family protein [Candidatus Limnocylindrales bacterium]|nr:DUF2516 family protein [Candidatus Limnocylindrales bacterium]